MHIFYKLISGFLPPPFVYEKQKFWFNMIRLENRVNDKGILCSFCLAYQMLLQSKHFYFIFKILFIYFFREKGREGKREG